MELNKEKILKNYSDIENDIKKYSPYPEKVKILFVTKYFAFVWRIIQTLL